jgi:endoglucanase
MKPKIPVAVLLTRAEEVGFIGALAAVHAPAKSALLRKADDLLLAIECSAEQPYARQGDGVILRVGDRTSIFNSSLTAFLHDTSQAMQKQDPTFKFQRALMPGGTCESTVYDAWGYHAAAVCLSLGNYHNMDRTRRKIAPENIALSDYRHMVSLFLRLAMDAHTYTPGHAPRKKRLTDRYLKMRGLLATGGGR